MKTWRILKRRYRKIGWFLAVLGLVNSVWSAALLVLINKKLAGASISSFDATLFMTLMVISFVAQMVFQKAMIKLINTTIFRINMDLMERIRATEFQKFQSLQKGDVYAVLGDLQVIGSAPPIFIEAFNCVTMIVIALIYLTIISWQSALMILATMLVLLIVYLKRNKEIIDDLNRNRNYRDDLHASIDDLLNGFREIQMSQERTRNIFFKFIRRISKLIKETDITTSYKYLKNELSGRYSWFVVIWFILFVLPQATPISTNQISAFIVTILFIISPVQSLVGFIPNYARLKIALQRVNGIEEKLGQFASYSTPGNIIDPMINKNVRSIEFHEVTFRYNYDTSTEFTVGPFSTNIDIGQVNFIVGGNGSGKSTMLYLLAGLYQPASGFIKYNGCAIKAPHLKHYRDQFSFVFSDHYSLSKNYNNYILNGSNPAWQEYLCLLKLDNKISADTFSMGTKLSRGQMKRLALVLALLEERQIIILDEWAAEQDPEFRKYFYETILPYLKSKGKTVIAASHDERYFHCADRIIRMEGGRIVHQENQPTYAKN